MASSKARTPVRRRAPQLALNGLTASYGRESAVGRERHARRPPETTANAVIEGDVLDVLRSLPAERSQPPIDKCDGLGNARVGRAENSVRPVEKHVAEHG